MTPVKAGDEEMSLEKQLRTSINTVKEIVARVDATPAIPATPAIGTPPYKMESLPTSDEITTYQRKHKSYDFVDAGPVVRSPSDKTFYFYKCSSPGARRITTPAGLPPCKPTGYKQKNWPDGPASDEVVENWALEVYASDEERYSVEAVIYWARYFWDIHSPEFKRITNLILGVLAPNRQIV